MTQVLESAQTSTANSVAGNGRNAFADLAPNATVYVYGHGPTRNPFYEEARALRAAPEGALLILSAAVGRGQKLLLISAAGEDPAEAQVVRTRTLGAQMFEVEIAFSFPRPEFWKPFAGGAKKNGTERRRSQRVQLPRGMTIAWQGGHRRDVSRVSSLSFGGLFIETAEPAQAGDTLQVQFDIPGGPVRGHAVVRRSVKGQGMGIEFKELLEGSRARLNELLQKLLGDVRKAGA